MKKLDKVESSYERVQATCQLYDNTQITAWVYTIPSSNAALWHQPNSEGKGKTRGIQHGGLPTERYVLILSAAWS